MVMDFNKMCDRCFKTLNEDETLYAFSIWDDNGEVRVLKGHDVCIVEMREMLKQEGMELEDSELEKENE
jgi:Ca2+-binding EF-hand superfamily protein